jgi:hypothetical protein
MVRPLRSLSITESSSLLWAGPNANPAPVLNPSRFPPLETLPLATTFGSSVGASLPTFHVKAADRARVAYMPGTAWPVTGYPPDSSWNLVHAPVLMPSKTNFDTSIAIRLRSPSRSPPDASRAPFSSSLTTMVFSQRSTRRFDATPRRATPKGHQSFIFHAAAHRSRPPTYIRNLSLCARGTRTMRVLSSLKTSPLGASHAANLALTCSACSRL